MGVWAEWRATVVDWVAAENSWRPWVVTGGVVAVGGYFLWRRTRAREKLLVTGTDPALGRPLGLIEKVLLQSSERGNAIMGNVLVIGTKTEVTETQIREALRRLAMRHPLLRMRIVHRGNIPWFVPLSHVVVPLKTSDTSDWIMTLEDEILSLFDNKLDRPLWRVLYLPNAVTREACDSHPHRVVLCFVFDHTIVDGMSCCHLMSDLLDTLAEVVEKRLPALDDLLIMPPLDNYVEPTLRESLAEKLNRLIFWFFVNYTSQRKKLLAPFLTPSANPWVEKFGVESLRADVSPRTCMSPYAMSRDETSSLIRKCKEHKVSVQAALQTAASFAVCRLWSQLDTDAELFVECSLPVNVRSHFARKIDPHHLGLYIMVCIVGAQVSAKPRNSQHFWSVAKDVHDSIRSQINNKTYMWYYNVICKQRGVANISHEELDEAAKLHNVTGGRYQTILMFTNLGDCSFLNRPESSPVKLIERFQAPAEQNVGSIFGNDIVTFEGRLFWNMLFYNNITSRQTFELYAAYTKENIERLVNEDWQDWEDTKA